MGPDDSMGQDDLMPRDPEVANPFLGETVGGMLAAMAARVPEGEAIVATDRRITYRALYAEARRFARALLAQGIRKGDKVALWLPNRPAWLVAQYGCALVGAVGVALNPRYKVHELSYILAQSDATALLLTDHLGRVDFLDTLDAVLPSLREAEPGALVAEGFPTRTTPTRAVCGSPICSTTPPRRNATRCSRPRASPSRRPIHLPSSTRRAPRLSPRAR